MTKLTTQDEFLTVYSEQTGYTKSSIKNFMDSFGAFIEYCIENNVEWKYGNVMEFYFSQMKGRNTVKVGTKDERINLPPVLKAKIRLANKHRKKQKEQNRFLKDILVESEAQEQEDFPTL